MFRWSQILQPLQEYSFDSVSFFVVGICLSNYNLNSFLIHQASYSKWYQWYLVHKEVLRSICKIGRYPINASEVLTQMNQGQKIIVAQSGGRYGFIHEALLTFKAASGTCDYHSETDGNTFTRRVKEMLISNLNQPSVSVMYNASHHENRQLPNLKHQEGWYTGVFVHQSEKSWFCCMQTTKAQTSLRICTVWSSFLLFVHRKVYINACFCKTPIL